MYQSCNNTYVELFSTLHTACEIILVGNLDCHMQSLIHCLPCQHYNNMYKSPSFYTPWDNRNHHQVPHPHPFQGTPGGTSCSQDT